MSVTINELVTNLDTYIGDTSTDRISQAERFQALTEATVWIQEELENDLQNATYALNYYDSVYSYKITTAVADLLEGADLRRSTLLQDHTFAKKSSRELAEEIGQGATEISWTIERRDGDTYIVVNHNPTDGYKQIADFDSSTTAGGTWQLNTTTGDGTNLTVDTVEYKQGNASFNFDIDVSQTANNKVVVYSDDINSLDLSSYEDLSAWIFWVYIPTVTEFSSVTYYWGSSSSAYWSATVTTDIDGSAFVAGWNRILVNWEDATKTSTPDVSAIVFIQFDLNYTGSQVDDTDYRIDYLRLAKPEKLTFHYLSWNVGTNTGGTDITAFSATTDVPYFSGQYDQYKYAVAHKAAALLFRTPLRLRNESNGEEVEAEKAMRRAKKIIPSSKVPEVKSFKVLGVNFSKR